MVILHYCKGIFIILNTESILLQMWKWGISAFNIPVEYGNSFQLTNNRER